VRSVSVDFSIVTPSLNMLSYLKRCAASISDQANVALEHIVMDGGSSDGTAEWLKQNKQIISIVQKDKGMYDAINKGLFFAKGEFVSYLNCDEQYLPDALSFVKKYFEQHPEVDIVFGDFLLIRPDGSLIAYRKGYQPRWFYILSSYLYVFSCAMFVRRKVIVDGFRFDDRLKAVSDADFVVRVLRQGYRVVHLQHYLAAFTMTGKNLYAGRNALLERKRWMNTAPTWVRVLRWPLNGARHFERLISGAFWQKMPLEYAVYASDDVIERQTFRVRHASFRWRTG
jgi:glycosyltransferase involved in cell wall biosynthesis